ncbi:signal transducing adaptor molecule [Anticarsia gemmatalis]|uniref:signal transducing adaptor molecule n=1 Tax=Anticarsia gemmatalis TaxID=129554 RepID=UPI003F766D87
MGIFGNSSPFDQDVERATSENNTSEEWGLIMEICDRAGASTQSAKECLRAVMRRLAHPDPHVQVHAATLLDACVANCGRAFHLEVASRDFETEYRRLLARAQPAVAARLRALLRKWAEGEFRDDPQLDLIPSLHAKLRAEGGEAAPRGPDAAAAAAAREQEDLARAISLSLREAAPAPAAAAAALYPRVEPDAPPQAPPRKVRALYDFEAAEDNELTFLAGEIVHVTDSSDPNWWKGYNERGEGLFPANFVTGDLAEPRPRGDNAASGAASAGAGANAGPGPGAAPDEDAAPARIDESTMDAALTMLHEADPREAGSAEAEAALSRLEARAHAMGSLVDAALERADRRHARLTQLSAELVDALNLYHSLMRDPLKPAYGSLAGPAPPAPPAPPALHHAAPPYPPHAYAPPSMHPQPPRC